MDDGKALVPEVLQQAQAQFVPLEVIEQHKSAGAKTLADARVFEVDSADDFEIATTFRRKIKEYIATVKSVADPMCQGLDRAHDAACKLRTSMMADYSLADKIVEKLQKDYVQKRRQEEELLKAQQLAEAKRIEEENREALAQELEKAKEPELAQQTREAPVIVHVPTPPSLVPSGVRQLWKVKGITDIIELAAFVVANPALSHFIEADLAALRKYKIDNPKAEIPGVEFELDDSIPVRKE